MSESIESVANDKEGLEPERSGGGKASLSSPSSEVAAIPTRRRFGREFKLKILKELEVCKMHAGERMKSCEARTSFARIKAGSERRRPPSPSYMRLRLKGGIEKGLFSSQISQWKTSMVNTKKKAKSNTDKNELARLKRRVARLEATIQKKDYIIEAQKKMSEILDNLSKASTGPPVE